MPKNYGKEEKPTPSNSANTPKSGQKGGKAHDPKTTGLSSSGGGMNVTSMYSPAGKGPRNPDKGSNKG